VARPLVLILILSLAFGAAARPAPHHGRHHRSRHLVIEMKDHGRGGRPALAGAAAQPRQPGAIGRRLGAKGAVGSLGFNRGQAVAHPDELNGPGAARFNHADSAVGAKVSVPF